MCGRVIRAHGLRALGVGGFTVHKGIGGQGGGGRGGNSSPPDVHFLFSKVHTNFGLIYYCPPFPRPPMHDKVLKKFVRY